MTAMTHDDAGGPAHGLPAAEPSRLAAGFGFALVSAASFGLAGAVGKGLLEAGWSPAAAVTARVLGALLVLVVPAYLALRSRPGVLAGRLPMLAVYGTLAVAATQLCYFYAVTHMSVGAALLIEYTAPVAVVVWMWLRRGERPGALTVLGAVVALVGLALVLDLVSGADLSLVGVAWALGAMVGVATYFVMSADDSSGIPPLILASSGMAVGGLVLLLAGVVGLVPFQASTRDVAYEVATVPWWLPVLALAVVTAATAYVTGIRASRILGSRVSSFVGLLEVVFALLFAWLLLAELPRAVQLLGGVLILVGVIVVKAGERR